MPLEVPDPAKEKIDALLRAAFERAQATWARTGDGLPPVPDLCPLATDPCQKTRGRKAKTAGKKAATPNVPAAWLAGAFPNIAKVFARSALGGGPGTPELLDAVAREIANMKVDYARVAPTISALTAAGLGPGQDRRFASSVMCEYLNPLLDAYAYRQWLSEMAGAEWFWRSGKPGSRLVPQAVWMREQDRDRALRERVVGGARERTRASAVARSEAVIGSEPTASVLPVVVFKGGVAPANLFISEVAALVGQYLRALEPVLQTVAGPLGLAVPLRGVAYGVLALALVPVYCLYDNYHGTCVVEKLLPRLGNSVAAMADYTRRSLLTDLTPRLRRRLIQDDQRAVALLNAFGTLAGSLADATRNSHDQLLRVAADQGGRVPTPPQQFTKDGLWKFQIRESAVDSAPVEYKAPEMLKYGTSYEESREIYWILPAIWRPVATAVGLCNQAGMQVWFNAANNRWGGKHPPHCAHRQGVSLDVNVGFEWRTKTCVSNVKKRDRSHVPFPDSLAPGNSKNEDCLHGMERIAGWILTQAFLLAGVRYYVYGDWALVEEATAHLGARVNIERPARLEWRLDPRGHNDHWHFEMFVGERPSGVDPYVWQVSDPELLDHLHALAVDRDSNINFWRKMAGPLKDPPTQASDFADLPDAEDWQKWWRWGHESGAGISLLPVWASSKETGEQSDAEKLTRGSQSCKKVPEGDYPNSTSAGEVYG